MAERAITAANVAVGIPGEPRRDAKRFSQGNVEAGAREQNYSVYITLTFIIMRAMFLNWFRCNICRINSTTFMLRYCVTG